LAVKPKGRFLKITEYSNWCYYDRLGGVDLKDDEKLEIEWPNGQHTRVTVRLREFSTPYQDHSHPTSIPHKEAYCKIMHKGHPIKVRLVGLKARRIQ